MSFSRGTISGRVVRLMDSIPDPAYCANLLSFCSQLQSVTLVFADRGDRWGYWSYNPAHPMSIFVRAMPCAVPLLVFERGSAFEHNDPLSSAELDEMATALVERFGESRPTVQLRIRDNSVLRTRGRAADDSKCGIIVPIQEPTLPSILTN